MSERERFERWFEHEANVRMSDLPENEAWYIWQARARIAKQREAELVRSLKAAKCPQCDGSGAVQAGPDDICQCQWCHERDAILAKYEAERT